MYDNETIKQLNSSVNLVDYISNILPLEKKGNRNDYFCSCPWHTDITPSFSVNDEKNLFYCFSCGKGGGIINFIQYYEKVSFEEAINKTMEIANIDPHSLCQSKTVSFLKNINDVKIEKKDSHEILNKTLYDKYSKEPITLWLDEGIDADVLDLFEIRIDHFSNRIVYPVYDMDGNFINIKGRTLYPNYKELKLPKYINFKPVGTVDYFQGYNVTKDYIEKSKSVIIFESVKSVMKAYQWGYKNCMSAEKHTLTDEQLNILINLKKDVIFAFDTDVDYFLPDVKKTLDQLSKLTNVYIIKDVNGVLGGPESKNAPVDCGKDNWEYVYKYKTKYPPRGKYYKKHS